MEQKRERRKVLEDYEMGTEGWKRKWKQVGRDVDRCFVEKEEKHF